MNHRHRAVESKTEVRAYRYPVGPAHLQNPTAHGGVCLEQVCSCGATRLVNSNAGQQEYGVWIDAPLAFGGGK